MLGRRQVGGLSCVETRRTSVEGVSGKDGVAPPGRTSDGGRSIITATRSEERRVGPRGKITPIRRKSDQNITF